MMKNKIMIIFGAIFITSIIWIPYIFPYFSNVDEPGHFVDAFALLKGKLLYKEVFECRGPLIPLIYAFFVKISSRNYTFFLHLALFLMLFIECGVIYKILLRMNLKNLATYAFFYPVFLSLFYPVDMITGGEPFISLLLLLICYFFLSRSIKFLSLSITGLLSGLICLFKPFGILLIFLLCFYIYFKYKNFKKIIFFFLISLTPILIFLLYLTNINVLQDFLLWNIKYPLFISKSVSYFRKIYFIFPMLGRIFLLIPFFTVFGTYEVIKKNKYEEEVILYLFLIFSILWGISHGLPFPHYYRLTIPFFFIISLKGYFSIVGNERSLVKNILSVFIIFSILQGFFYWNGFDFYKKWIKFIKDKKWSKKFEERSNIEILKFLKENTVYNEKIVVWGHNPKLYLLSNREPGTRFKGWLDPVIGIVYYDISKIHQFPLAEEAFISDMIKNTPKYFIDATKCSLIGIPNYSVDRYPKIYKFILKNYKKVKEIKGYVIYQYKK